MIRLVEAVHRASPFFSFIMGLGLAAILFHRTYGEKLALAMPLHETVGKVVRSDGKCWRYRVEDATCESSS
jgi:hypothetical protein